MGNSFFAAPFLSLLVEEGNSANQALIIAAVFSSLLIVISGYLLIISHRTLVTLVVSKVAFLE